MKTKASLCSSSHRKIMIMDYGKGSLVAQVRIIEILYLLGDLIKGSRSLGELRYERNRFDLAQFVSEHNNPLAEASRVRLVNLSFVDPTFVFL